jgi:hypothetical protein
MVKKHVKPLAENKPRSAKSIGEDCSSVVIFPPGCDASNETIHPCKIQCTASCTESCELVKIKPVPPPPKPP